VPSCVSITTVGSWALRRAQVSWCQGTTTPIGFAPPKGLAYSVFHPPEKELRTELSAALRQPSGDDSSESVLAFHLGLLSCSGRIVAAPVLDYIQVSRQIPHPANVSELSLSWLQVAVGTELFIAMPTSQGTNTAGWLKKEIQAANALLTTCGIEYVINDTPCGVMHITARRLDAPR
jgi:hypothetical protein